jgi:hypothetical protein
VFCITDSNDGAIEASVSTKYVVKRTPLPLGLIDSNSVDLPNNVGEDALLKVWPSAFGMMYRRVHRSAC